MPNKIIIKKSSVAAKVPLATDLEIGELAVNLADQKLYSKNASGTVVLVGNNANGTVTSVTAGSYLTGDTITSSGTLAVDATSSNTVNKIVARDANGDTNVRYLYSQYVNMSHGAADRTSDTVFYSSTDAFVRKNTSSGFRQSLNVPTRTGGDASGTWGISVTGTSLNVTGTVAIANGGTGLTSIGANGTFLKSNGTTASWQSLPSVLSLLNRSGSSVSVSVGNGLLSVLNRSGSTINVSLS